MTNVRKRLIGLAFGAAICMAALTALGVHLQKHAEALQKKDPFAYGPLLGDTLIYYGRR